MAVWVSVCVMLDLEPQLFAPPSNYVLLHLCDGQASRIRGLLFALDWIKLPATGADLINAAVDFFPVLKGGLLREHLTVPRAL